MRLLQGWWDTWWCTPSFSLSNSFSLLSAWHHPRFQPPLKFVGNPFRSTLTFTPTTPSTSLDPETFRSWLRTQAFPVYLLSIHVPGFPPYYKFTTVSSVTSISLTPPTVSFALTTSSFTSNHVQVHQPVLLHGLHHVPQHVQWAEQGGKKKTDPHDPPSKVESFLPPSSPTPGTHSTKWSPENPAPWKEVTWVNVGETKVPCLLHVPYLLGHITQHLTVEDHVVYFMRVTQLGGEWEEEKESGGGGGGCSATKLRNGEKKKEKKPLLYRNKTYTTTMD
ncbi:hypothetical protein HMI54_009745 [Coelomomyces lativittatus]|nr:hypothetical protein HMI56_003413 [Coelomomyces lativittatus]KAJ1502991.1 hypothetical protein HMI55_002659 [Coelomomyces lativittatus]KAJ1516368.1 hypothetical protein HMI54_009745 [Coelomomyces lativittatus]